MIDTINIARQRNGNLSFSRNKFSLNEYGYWITATNDAGLLPAELLPDLTFVNSPKVYSLTIFEKPKDD